ncbi:MAG: hypothetical protein LCH61_02415 [Proteobacteria bacterium]|nr:hypothetical protein [Pseudomonadota bacterium]
MSNPLFKLPIAGAAALPHGHLDARAQLERLYREIGVSAVASALHVPGTASCEDFDIVRRAAREIPPQPSQSPVAA